MDNVGKDNACWTMCPECLGRGKKSQKIRKKARLRYQREVSLYEQSNKQGSAPIPPKGNLIPCTHCNGTGLLPSATYPVPDTVNYPHIAIIGAGIGGAALAVACLHRGIPFTLYERDLSFDARAQGYGLTLQQASNAIKALGIPALANGVTSTKHLVHTTDGEVIGEWGMRKWLEPTQQGSPRRNNVHIARQSLRSQLLEQLNGSKSIQWGHQLIDFTENSDSVELTFNVNGGQTKTTADLVVGADGIRSSMRQLSIGENSTPLQYLGCIVILGICPLNQLEGVESELLDSATVFQTVNGTERIYMMPYSSDTIMWQLSFPMSETEAKALSKQGANALKQEAVRRTQWHHPIPQIVAATQASEISGYPVYDRTLLTSELLDKMERITLLGDAAHPMSPFKGQGANQALLDALSLARKVSVGCRALSNWREVGIRARVLNDFEAEMLERSASKVKGSADAVSYLHSDVVMDKMDAPRGRLFEGKDLKK